jgi:hypothetical protein
MSENLRDRIAAALYRNLRRQQGIDRPDRFLDWIDNRELADAVLEMLEMQVGASALFLVDDKKVIHNRYTTKWVADE